MRPAVGIDLDALPAEEDVAGGLHEPLPGHHPLAVVGVFAGPGEVLEYGPFGLLHLQEQGVRGVVPEQQDDRAASPDAAYSDHLAGFFVDVKLPTEVSAVCLHDALARV